MNAIEKKWKILVLDNVMVTREGISTILKRVAGVELVRPCENFTQVLEELKKTSFNLIVLDLQAERSTGIIIGRELLDLYPEVNIIVYSKIMGTRLKSELYRQEYLEVPYRRPISRNGNLMQNLEGNSQMSLTLSLHGYTLIQNITPERFEANLSYLEIHNKFVDPEISQLVSEQFDKSKLTPRELQCSELISQGKSNQEIATALGITRRAVENLINNIYHKLLIGGEPKDPSRRVLLALTVQNLSN